MRSIIWLRILFCCELCLAGCPGFYKAGYRGMFYQNKSGKVLCSVECDNDLGYYAGELSIKLNSTINYRTIYIKRDENWEPLFEDTVADINCMYGCESVSDLANAPYYLKVTQISFISIDPTRKISQAIVECKQGYFTSNKIDSNQTDLKILIVCTRNENHTSDRWAWAKGSSVNLECHRGCPPFGMKSPVHQNGFASQTVCKHLGRSGGNFDLVSGCESMCDQLNGYFPINDKSSVFKCGDGGDYEDENIFFLCEQGCRVTEEDQNIFTDKNLELSCKKDFAEGWYGKCVVSCIPGYVTVRRGRMGKADIALCTKGHFNLETVQIICAKGCGESGGSCDGIDKCVGLNEFKEKFCWMKKLTIKKKVSKD